MREENIFLFHSSISSTYVFPSPSSGIRGIPYFNTNEISSSCSFNSWYFLFVIPDILSVLPLTPAAAVWSPLIQIQTFIYYNPPYLFQHFLIIQSMIVFWSLCRQNPLIVIILQCSFTYSGQFTNFTYSFFHHGLLSFRLKSLSHHANVIATSFLALHVIGFLKDHVNFANIKKYRWQRKRLRQTVFSQSGGIFFLYMIYFKPLFNYYILLVLIIFYLRNI